MKSFFVSTHHTCPSSYGSLPQLDSHRSKEHAKKQEFDSFGPENTTVTVIGSEDLANKLK